MGRRLRMRLPDFTGGVKTNVPKREQNPYRGSDLRPLQPGDHVRMHQDGGWTTKAKVQDTVAPRSYTVVTEDNKEFRRNRQHLLPTAEKVVVASPVVDEDIQMTSSHVLSSADHTETTVSTTAANNGNAAPLPSLDTEPPESECGLRRSSRVRRPPDRLVYM